MARVLKLKIRRASVDDLPALAELGCAFYKEGKIPGRIEPDEFVHHWTCFIEMGLGVILNLVRGDRMIIGAIGAIIGPDPNNGDLVAQEAFWFVHPEQRGGGLSLLARLEGQVALRGVKRFSMVHLVGLNDRLGKIYERRGYRKQEIHYIKEF